MQQTEKKPKGGKGKGHTKKIVAAPIETVVPAAPAAPAPPAPEVEPDDSTPKEHGNGKGHDKEHKHKG